MKYRIVKSNRYVNLYYIECQKGSVWYMYSLVTYNTLASAKAALSRMIK